MRQTGLYALPLSSPAHANTVAIFWRGEQGMLQKVRLRKSTPNWQAVLFIVYALSRVEVQG